MIATREKQPPPCVNLLERFGERYRITFDGAADAHGRQRDKIDPYLQQIPCRYGTIWRMVATTWLSISTITTS